MAIICRHYNWFIARTREVTKENYSQLPSYKPKDFGSSLNWSKRKFRHFEFLDAKGFIFGLKTTMPSNFLVKDGIMNQSPTGSKDTVYNRIRFSLEIEVFHFQAQYLDAVALTVNRITRTASATEDRRGISSVYDNPTDFNLALLIGVKD